MSQHSASSRRRASARRSNFRSIRVEEDALVRRLRSRHTLWLHGGLMGLITLLVMWGVSTALRHGGVDSLALRYALGIGDAGGLLFDPATQGNISRATAKSVGVRFHELSVYLGTALFF